jgi:hypothetical protein
VVTVTFPVVPLPITATIWVPLLEVIEATAVPPIFTSAAVVPERFVPFIVIDVPTQPLDEPKLEMVGAGGGVQVYVCPEVGLVAVRKRQVLLFAVPVVDVAHVTPAPINLLLKSVLDAPLKPTCAVEFVLFTVNAPYLSTIVLEVSFNLI